MSGPLEPKPENFPALLLPLKRWCVWRLETRDGKPTKVPYVGTNHRGRSNDPGSWITYQRAAELFKTGSFSGYGVFTGQIGDAADHLIGLDWDHTNDSALWGGMDEPAVVHEAIAIGSYTERSPSGVGLRVFALLATIPGGARKGGGREVYQAGRFLTITGHRTEGSPADVVSVNEQAFTTFYEALVASQKRSSPPSTSRSRAKRAPTENQVGEHTTQQQADAAGIVIPNPELDDETVLSLAEKNYGDKFRAARDDNREGDRISETDQAFCNYVAPFCSGVHQIAQLLQTCRTREKTLERPDYTIRTATLAWNDRTLFYSRDLRRLTYIKTYMNRDSASPLSDIILPDDDMIVRIGTDSGGPATKQREIVNSPKTGIIRREIQYRGDNPPNVSADILAGYYLKTIRQFDNPADPHDTQYSATFISVGNKEAVNFSEKTLESIVAGFMKKPGIFDRRRLPDALSILFHEFRNQNLVEKEIKMPATGFWLDRDEILWGKTAGFAVSLPEKTRAVDIRAGFKAIEEMLLFFSRVDSPEKLTRENCRQALAVLYWYVQAPLGFIRKQLGTENQYLLLYGTPHVGKTIAAKYGESIWGIDLDRGIIGGSSLTAPQLAQHFNKTSLPLAIDEVRNILTEAKIAEMIKNSSTGVLIKERIDSRAGFQTSEFRAYASLCFTCNFLPTLYLGVLERLILVEYTEKNRIDDVEAVKTFESHLHMNRASLAHIGNALREMFIDPMWIEQIKHDIMGIEPLLSGYKFLVALCKRNGIKPPDWIRVLPHTSGNDVVAANPADVLFRYLADTYLDSLRKYAYADHEENFDDEGRSRMRRVQIPTSWEDRLQLLKERNLFPHHTRNYSREGNLIIRGDITREISEKMGFETTVSALVKTVPGAKDYADGVRVIRIPAKSFIDYFREIDPENSPQSTLQV